MYNISNFEYDCTHKCRLREHGNTITAALTKRSIDDDKLAAFIAKTCCNFCDIVDDLGRSAVHLTASMNRYAVLEWLLNQGAIISGRDYESGSSPLHRAIYYGCIDCAVLLLRYGANLDLLDEDTRCPLQSVCRLSDMQSEAKIAENNEILVWGSNKNYNLGISNLDGATTPQSVDFFRKEHISIETVAMGAYHSLFLDKKSQLYAVGHGNGGRLGIGIENSLPAPKKVKVPIKNAREVIICISTSRKHSLLLTNRSVVFACGLNDDQQLGVRDAGSKLTVFKEVLTLRDMGVESLLRVMAFDHHSLAYSNKFVYVWGTNNGQLCVEPNAKIVPLPKVMKLPPRTTIQFVEGNNSATVVATGESSIIMFYNGKMKSLRPPNFESLKSISVVGGDTTKSAKGTATALKLLMLTQTNVVFLWYEMTQNFYRCIFSQIRITQIDKIFYKANQVLILSQGDVYRGKCIQVPVPVYANQQNDAHTRSADANNIWIRCDQNLTEISKDHMIRIDLQRLPNIDRAVNIFCDEDFVSFAVLQESNMKYFKLPNLQAEEYSFKKLYSEVNEFDAVHDVVFHIDGETFAAHKFIVFSRAPALGEIISGYVDKNIHLNFERLSGKMFELMLKYMYTNYFPNEQDLDDIQTSLGPDSPANQIDVCRLYLQFVQKFQLSDLATFLDSFLQQKPFYLPHLRDKSKYRFNRLHRTDLPTLADVRIICADNIELSAHKCILVARLEYFDMMFTHSWAEQTVINLSTVPVEYMTPILDFIYSSDVENFRRQNYSTTFLYNMIVFCDQFFIERLRKICEILILDKITIRKCGDMLDFGCMYNCETLKRGCMQFICQNLARVLTQKSLDQCEPETLKCINEYYREIFKSVFDYRIITPDADAVDDELLLSFVDDFQVDLSYRMNENEEALKVTGAKSKTKENKTRQYEREAISTMIETMSLNKSERKSAHEMETKTLKESHEISEKLHAEAKSWMKVVDKKDVKKKLPLEQILKANEALKDEDKSKMEYVILEKSSVVLTPEKDGKTTTTEIENITPAKVYNLNFSDFTPAREKLSQKQRKRLTSESSSTSWRQPASPRVEQSKPVAVTPNAWGVVAQSSPNNIANERVSAFSVSPPTGSAGDASSFANMMRGNIATSPNTSNVNNNNNNSFSRILAEERKERDYYERMRTKSLALTQIEESAITELRAFYNADNVDDEIITIERKPLPRTINFAVWQRN